MKTLNKLFQLFFILSVTITFGQQGIGTTTPNPNAALDVSATDKGMMVPRLTNAEAATLAADLVAADDGLVIYNTSEKCIQFWDGSTLQFVCAARVGGGSSGNAGVVKVNFDVSGGQTAEEARAADNTSHPSYMEWSNGGSAIPLGTFAIIGTPQTATPGFDSGDLIASSFPTTNWPENTPVDNQNLDGNPAPSAIYRDNTTFTNGTIGDAWLENEIPGQVHIWRLNILGDPNNSSGAQIEAQIRNPQSGFVTGYVQVAPSTSGDYEQTFTFTTIADNASLPSGGGNGYVIEIRSNSDQQSIWLESLTRVSLYNE